MTEAHAIHFEAVKYAYRQSKDGVVVSFVVHPNDVPALLATSLIGARYMVALVEIGDDEQPVKQPEVKPEKKREWHELLCAQQAGIRCNECRLRNVLERRTSRRLA